MKQKNKKLKIVESSKREIQSNQSLKFINKYYIISAIALLTIMVYLRMFHNSLTNWDDDIYVVSNPYIKSLGFENLQAIFSNFYCGNYHPFSMLCYAFGYQIGGLDAWPYQIINLILHACNVVLVYLFISALLKQQNASENIIGIVPLATALLFGIHTMHVESVAWVSENKNLLYTFFFLSSLIVYLKFLKNRTARFYIFSVLLFVFSLLSKGMAVSLSVTLLAIDLFLGRRLSDKKVWLEKLPYLALSLIFGVIAVYAQKSTASVLEKGTFTLFERISFASFGFVQYLIKLILPVNLSALYAYPDKTGGTIPVYFYLFPFIVTGGLILVYFKIRKIPEYLFGALFFVINIALLLQLIPVGDAYMADRYCYVPSIGFLFILAFIFSKILQRKSTSRKLITGVGIIYVFLLAFLSFQRIGIWKDSLTLWNDVLAKYTNNPKAWNNRGVAYSMNENFERAIEDYNTALRIKTNFKEAYMNRATAYKALGKSQLSLDDFNKLAELDPVNGYLYNNRATLYSDMGNLQAALLDYNKAILIINDNTMFYSNRAELKTKLGDYNSAIADCDSAIILDTKNAGAYNNRGIAKKSIKDYRGAMSDFSKALEINSNYADAIFNRGTLYKEMGNEEAALNDFKKAAGMGKSSDEALILRGLQKMQENNLQGALDDFNKALEVSPSYAGYMNRGVIFGNMGKFVEAITDYSRAIEIDPNSSLAYMNRCNARINTNEYKEALIDINVSIQLDPNNGLAYINRGIVEVYLADYTKAINDFNFVLKTNQHPAAFYYRGLAFIKSGNKQAGCSDIHKAKEMGYNAIDQSILQICN